APHHENPCNFRGLFVRMYHVYVLYSPASGKSYIGFTNDIERRIFEHNVSESQGFTLRYRPWQIIHTESFEVKSDAMKREKYLKSGQGREIIKKIIWDYLKE